MKYRLGDDRVEMADDAWIADTAVVIGKVRLEAGASVWFNAVLRGDNELILIGENAKGMTAIQCSDLAHIERWNFGSDLGIRITVAQNCRKRAGGCSRRNGIDQGSRGTRCGRCITDECTDSHRRIGCGQRSRAGRKHQIGIAGRQDHATAGQAQRRSSDARAHRSWQAMDRTGAEQSLVHPGVRHRSRPPCRSRSAVAPLVIERH